MKNLKMTDSIKTLVTGTLGAGAIEVVQDSNAIDILEHSNLFGDILGTLMQVIIGIVALWKLIKGAKNPTSE